MLESLNEWERGVLYPLLAEDIFIEVSKYPELVEEYKVWRQEQ